MNATTTTRKQLRGLGLSLYLARQVTRNLTPAQQKGRAYLYRIEDVVASIHGYSSKPRIKKETREVLEAASKQLLSAIEKYIPVAFGDSTDPELGRLAKQAMRQIRKTDRTLAALKLEAAEAQAEFVPTDLH
ncbi:MAG: hypothetical protein AAF974_02200 [Cyanobacteria bacterium P01_E01_bin.34]